MRAAVRESGKMFISVPPDVLSSLQPGPGTVGEGSGYTDPFVRGADPPTQEVVRTAILSLNTVIGEKLHPPLASRQ